MFHRSIPEPPRIRVGDEEVERVNSSKLLGVSCQNDLKWNKHVDEITRKAMRYSIFDILKMFDSSLVLSLLSLQIQCTNICAYLYYYNCA